MADSLAMQQAFQAFQEELDQASATIRSRFEDMRLSGLLDASGEQLKHLPGRHDQQRHDPHKGTAGTPVTREWFHNGGSKYVQGLSPEHREIVEESLVVYGVDQGDLEGISKITTDPPVGHTYVGSGGGVYYDGEGIYAHGAYDVATKTMHISKAALNHPSSRAPTILHELGHHVVEGNPDKFIGKFALAGKLKNRMEREVGNDELKLSEYGLRSYSLSAPHEFAADVYMADHMGRPEQRKKLAEFVAGSDLNIQDVYKQLGIKIPVQEIQAVRNGDLIEFITVDVEVDPAVLAAVPWYYIVGEELKHLPGRHNQLLHTPHMYRGRGIEIEHEYGAKESQQALEYLNLSEEDLRQMFWVPQASYTQVVIEPEEHGDGWLATVHVNWYDKDDTHIGTAQRSMYKDDAGKLVAVNHNLGIAAGNVGIGSILYANQVRLLKERGYRRIILQANSTIGKYAWARKGFEFSSVDRYSKLNKANTSFGSWAQDHGVTKDMVGGSWPEFTSASDIANYDPGVKLSGADITNRDVKSDTTLHIGKAYMLDDVGGLGSWYGELVLNE